MILQLSLKRDIREPSATGEVHEGEGYSTMDFGSIFSYRNLNVLGLRLSSTLIACIFIWDLRFLALPWAFHFRE